MATDTEQLNRTLVIMLAIVIGSLLILYWLVMPVVVGSLADDRNLAQDQVGYLASVYSGGLCLSTFASIFWIRKVSWVWLVKLGSLGVIAGFCIVQLSGSFPSLLMGHAIASFSTGIAYAVTMALLGDSNHPARNFALLFFLQVVLGTTVNSVLPVVSSPTDTLALCARSMMVVGVFCILFAHWLPRRGCKTDQPGSSTPGQQRRYLLPVALGLTAIILVFTGDSGVWVFLERIGADQHSREFGGTLVSINLAAGAVGSLTAAWLAERWGYLWPMLIAIALSLASLLLFMPRESGASLIIGSFINGWAWNFGSAYRMALVARLDSSGRYTVLIPATQTLGNTLGPALTGYILVHRGYGLAFTIIAGLWLAALLFYYSAWRYLKDGRHDELPYTD
jgi:predicted MFS family arabinose efflux permease